MVSERSVSCPACGTSDVHLVTGPSHIHSYRCSLCAEEWPLPAPGLKPAPDRRAHERVIVEPGTITAALRRNPADT